jgi:hypothetical protein
MNNDDWFLIAVVAVAFIAGYSIISFIVKKTKSQQQTTPSGKEQADRRSKKNPSLRHGNHKAKRRSTHLAEFLAVLTRPDQG